MARAHTGGGDCKKVLQVGGSGEGNLPRKALTVLPRKDTEKLFSNLNKVVGTFEKEDFRVIWLGAMREFALPYCPWILEKKKEPVPAIHGCTSCVCTCIDSNDNSISKDATSKSGQKPVSDFFRVSKTTLFKKPPSQPIYREIPRVSDFESVSQVVDCWRKGLMPKKANFEQTSGPPLYTLKTSQDRVKVWPGYKDIWWKKSGNKNAYIRIKKIVTAVAKYKPELCNVETYGSDEIWAECVINCEEKLQGKSLSKIGI